MKLNISSLLPYHTVRTGTGGESLSLVMYLGLIVAAANRRFAKIPRLNFGRCGSELFGDAVFCAILQQYRHDAEIQAREGRASFEDGQEG